MNSLANYAPDQDAEVNRAVIIHRSIFTLLHRKIISLATVAQTLGAAKMR